MLKLGVTTEEITVSSEQSFKTGLEKVFKKNAKRAFSYVTIKIRLFNNFIR